MGSMEKGQKRIDAEKNFSLWLVAAALMHAVVIFLAIYLQILDANRIVKPKIVSVSIVSLPGSGGSFEVSAKGGRESAPAPEAPHPAGSKKSVGVKEALPELAPVTPKKEAKPVTPKKETKPVKIKEKVPEAAPAPPKKVAVAPLPAKAKPKAVDKPADITKTLERLKQNVDKKMASSPSTSAGSLNNALARLQQKVQSEGHPVSTGSGSGKGSSSGGRSGAGKGYGGGGPSAPYQAEIASIIMQNWEFSKLLLKNSYGMEVYVRINILANGTINKIVFDKKASSEYLNNSVKKALEKSSPLPVLPKQEGTGDVWIGFVFTPEGIEK